MRASFQPWGVSDQEAGLHAIDAGNCPPFTIVMSLDCYATAASKTKATITWQSIGATCIALIPSWVTLSSRFTLLSFCWALDWMPIVIVVNATQTGSFVDGCATTATKAVKRPQQLERGNPSCMRDYTSYCITIGIFTIPSFISNLPSRQLISPRSCPRS